jgi:hypothetical protein
MKHQAAMDIANWVLGLNHITAAVPVIVGIGHCLYPTARYTEKHGNVDEERLYVVGELPPFHGQMRRICYRTDDSEYAWLLVGWFRQRVTCTEWQEVHRFGSHFILALWSPLENWAADQCAKKPFRCVPITITHCDGPTEASVDQPHEEVEK